MKLAVPVKTQHNSRSDNTFCASCFDLSQLGRIRNPSPELFQKHCFSNVARENWIIARNSFRQRALPFISLVPGKARSTPEFIKSAMLTLGGTARLVRAS